MAWRMPLVIQGGFSLLMAIGTPFFPHSPTWLIHVGRHREAEVASSKLGIQASDSKKEEVGAPGVMNPPPIEARKEGWKHVKELFAKDVRGRTMLGVFLMGIQQVRPSSNYSGTLLTSDNLVLRDRCRPLCESLVNERVPRTEI